MYDKKISVIIPIYKVEEYIENCLDSVLNQTMNDIEIVCVNDGTPDNSMEVVYAKAQLDKRIVVVEKANGGLSSARNAGLEKAQGEYVMFLDSDDTLVPEALEYLYGIVSKKQLDIIYFGAKTVYENLRVKLSQYRKYSKYYQRKCSYPDVLSGAEMFHKLVENREYRMSACLQMIRRVFLKEKNFRFYEGILHEDNLFSFQTILAANRVLVVKDELYIRLMRTDSIMTGKGNVRSSWGYYVCLREMTKLVQNISCTKEICKSIHYTIMTTQREAILSIMNMKKEAVLEGLMVGITDEEKLNYEIVVLNSEWMRQQRRLITRIARKLSLY